MNNLFKLPSTALLLLTLSACAVQTIEGPVDPIISSERLPEEGLLDVSIAVFDAYEDVPDTRIDRNLSNLRRAEGIHTPWQIAEALRASRHKFIQDF